MVEHCHSQHEDMVLLIIKRTMSFHLSHVKDVRRLHLELDGTSLEVGVCHTQISAKMYVYVCVHGRLVDCHPIVSSHFAGRVSRPRREVDPSPPISR